MATQDNHPPDGARTLHGLAHTWGVSLVDAGRIAIASGFRPTGFHDGNNDMLYAPPAQRKEVPREETA